MNRESNVLTSFSQLFSRRQFLRRLGLLGVASSLPAGRLFFSRSASVFADSTNATTPVFRNRAPLAPSTFDFLPLGSIRPRGWLLDQLRIQAGSPPAELLILMF